MTYGLQIRNNDNQLTVSSEATLLNCVGKAQYLSTSYPWGEPEDSKPGRNAGYMNYRISNPNGDDRFIIAFDLPEGHRVGIIQDYATRISPGVWDFRVYCGSNPDGYGFDQNQTPFDIWIFAMTPRSASPSGAWGLCLYDSQGRLTMDFNKPHPLYLRDTIATNGLYNSTVNIVWLNRPVIIGTPSIIMGEIGERGGSNGNPYAYSQYSVMMRRQGNSQIVFEATKMRQYTFAEEPPDYSGLSERPTGLFLVEGNGLP